MLSPSEAQIALLVTIMEPDGMPGKASHRETSVTTDGDRDTRSHRRHARSLRFGFELGEDDHFAVSTLVSLGGAFLRASHVPRPGTVLTLTERFSPSGHPVTLRAEVVWGTSQPTLERPDTGFGVRFIDASTRGDPSILEDFLRILEPHFDPEGIGFEEGPLGARVVYRFGPSEIRPSEYTEEDGSPADFEDAHAPAKRTTEDVTLTPTAPDSTNPPAPQHQAPEASTSPPQKRPRGLGQAVTGIFTSLFRRVGRRDSEPVDSHQEPTPALPMASGRSREVMLTWGTTRAVGTLDSLGVQSATILIRGPLPGVGTAVLLRPIGLPLALADLAISTMVASHSDRLREPLQAVSVTFLRTDDPRQKARILEYVDFCGGR